MRVLLLIFKWVEGKIFWETQIPCKNKWIYSIIFFKVNLMNISMILSMYNKPGGQLLTFSSGLSKSSTAVCTICSASLKTQSKKKLNPLYDYLKKALCL